MTNHDNKHVGEAQLREQVSKSGVKKEYVERVAQALEAMGENNPKKELVKACVEAVDAHKKLDSIMKSFGEVLRDLGKSDVSLKEILAKFKLTEQKFGEPLPDNKLREVFGMPVHKAPAAPERKVDQNLDVGGFGKKEGG